MRKRKTKKRTGPVLSKRFSISRADMDRECDRALEKLMSSNPNRDWDAYPNYPLDGGPMLP